MNMRLTLLWEPSDDFRARLSTTTRSLTTTAGALHTLKRSVLRRAPANPGGRLDLPGVDDCEINGNTSKIGLNPALRAGLPEGYDDGQSGLEQETDFISLQMDWDVSENYTLTAVTGYVDLSHWELTTTAMGLVSLGAAQQFV